jgi:hypothetical protein
MLGIGLKPSPSERWRYCCSQEPNGMENKGLNDACCFMNSEGVTFVSLNSSSYDTRIIDFLTL